MGYKTLPAILILVCLSCNVNTTGTTEKTMPELIKMGNNENPYPLVSAIPLPTGYKHTGIDSSSFANWLLHVSLKKDKTVYLYDGSRKTNQAAQFAVLNIPVGNKNLQQCADAVMRLRAEYLYASKKFEEIIFTDNEGTGYYFKPPYNRLHFQLYLDKVFGMCGTASLSKQLKHAEMNKIQPGDVLVRGGFPGHATIVMDVAINAAGRKIFLLAQSYMPAQDIHILLNPSNETLSPWYEVKDDYYIETPEYTFTRSELKQW